MQYKSTQTKITGQLHVLFLDLILLWADAGANHSASGPLNHFLQPGSGVQVLKAGLEAEYL